MSDLTDNENFSIIKNFYNKCGFDFSNLKAEKESSEYDACTFQLNGKTIIHRTAKITPTKIGQFVTIWKRNENGQTEPFHVNDDFDLMIISTRKGDLFGQFIFPKSILLEKGIISSNKAQGKRGIRVYPPWDVTLNKQAQKTQQWQTEYFVDDTNESTDKANHLIKAI
ncbi:MepB family protein [Pedobacter frigiditerrae]|uniref:MepB family protein n=1 Tax=Pedobacter frigiditerrae TaxID=2530452 RepID=UPI00292EBFCE|nr:MepB family protein [Pedobacter frigiditerrae]